MIIIMINIIIIFICIIHSMCNMGVDQLRFDLTVPVSVGGISGHLLLRPSPWPPTTATVLRLRHQSC
jgi:hypothetical protein